MTQAQLLVHGRTPQVQIAVLQTKLLVGPRLVLVDLKRKRTGGVEYLDLCRFDLNVAR